MVGVEAIKSYSKREVIFVKVVISELIRFP